MLVSEKGNREKKDEATNSQENDRRGRKGIVYREKNSSVVHTALVRTIWRAVNRKMPF